MKISKHLSKAEVNICASYWRYLHSMRDSRCISFNMDCLDGNSIL